MTRLQTAILTSLALLISVSQVRAQLSNVVVVDFERAVVESAEGKKSSDKFNATLQSKQGEMEKRQKELEDLQRKLQTGARTLSDAAKAEIQRDIDRRTTEIQRRNEDAQKELQALRDELLRPIAERATAILNAMAVEQGYTLVVDLSNQENGVVWFNPKNDITAELIKRIDASTPKEAPKPTGAAPAPTTTKPPVTVAPKPTTPPPAAPPKE
jgi:outer membrane protein